jgi:hypothetical protein
VVMGMQFAKFAGPASEMLSPALVSNSMSKDASPPEGVSLFTVIVPEVSCNEGGPG